MSINKTIAMLVAIIPSIGFAENESADQLMACYHAGTTLDDKYSCMGSTINGCEESSGVGIAACANVETEVWQVIMHREITQIEEILSESTIISGPCEGNQDGCIQGLGNLVSDRADYAERQCAEEASPGHNGGHPEMAASLCQMREMARSTIQVVNFGIRMGQHDPD